MKDLAGKRPDRRKSKSPDHVGFIGNDYFLNDFEIGLDRLRMASSVSPRHSSVLIKDGWQRSVFPAKIIWYGSTVVRRGLEDGRFGKKSSLRVTTGYKLSMG